MKKIILSLIVVLVFSFNVVMAEEGKVLQRYKDVSPWHWAYETVEKLSSKGIISGYPDGTFLPDKTITRAEATKLLMLALNPNLVFKYSHNVCEDVKASHWASKYIVNGKLYVKIYDDGLFKPEQEITRLEFANAVAKSLEFVNITTDADTSVDNIVLTDISDLDLTSKNNIKFLIKLGIINGYEDNTFRPDKTLTRAETAKMLSLALIYKENQINDNMKETVSWYKCDPQTGWYGKMAYDLDGNLKCYVSDELMQLYYNGEYFMTVKSEVRTVKEEKLYTSDGNIWNIKWFGSDVVECIFEDNKYKIINHYQGKEYEFNNRFVSPKKAAEILEELFPFLEYDFEVKNDTVYSKSYVAGTEKSVGTMIAIGSYVDDKGKIKVDVEGLTTIIWDAEVNRNTKASVESLQKYK